MAKKAYGLFVNRFEIVTRNSYPVAAYLFKQHIDCLFADSPTVPIALNCYNRANPLYLIFNASSFAHSSQEGTQSGDVLRMKTILVGMPKDVDNWESQIKVVYAAGSPQFKTLFPKGKGPFNTGSQQKRVNAVAALLLSIGSDASLAAVKAIIQTFYDAMFAAFNTKGVSKKSTKTDSTATELARTNMCNMMEGNYGLILDTFKDEPTLGSKYFDEAYMSSHLQMSFAFKVKILSTRNILKRTFANPLTQQLQIINNSNTTLYMFLAVRKLGVVGTVFVTILPLSTTTHLLTEFGNPATDKFLKIYNTDNKIKADVVVNVL